ncbi:hypothetical protein GF324_06075, partial [bacterium]|nr:hypothetical protein [bacterium]
MRGRLRFNDKVVIVFAFLFAVVPFVTAAPASLYGAPFLQAYTPDEYESTGQCFDVAFAPNGVTYVANGGGVLEFDGRRWRTVENTGHQAFLAVAVDSLGRVWTGGISDFGVLVEKPDGMLRYQVLEPQLPDSLLEPRSVWRIRIWKGTLYLQTPTALLTYKPDRNDPRSGEWGIHTMENGKSLSMAMPARGKLWLKRRTEPLVTLQDDSFEVVPGAKDYYGHAFMHVLPFDDSSLLLTSYRRGLHLYDQEQGRFFPLPGELNRFLGSDIAFGSTRLPNGHFALASTQHGVIVYDREGRILEQVGRDEGLPTVVTRRRGVLDRNDGLWVPCDFGIARVELTSPFRVLGEAQGLDGAVLSLQVYRGTLYAATSRDLYRLERSDTPGGTGRFEPVEGVGRASWWLKANGPFLYVGTGRGLVQIDPEGHVVEVEGTNGNTFGMGFSNDGRYLYLGAELKGIFLYRLAQTGARFVDKIYESSRSIRFIHHDPQGRLWTIIENAGRVRLHRGPHDPTKNAPLHLTDLTDSLGIKGELHETMIMWRDRLWIGTTKGLFAYDSDTDRFLPDEEVLGFDVGPLKEFAAPIVDRAGRLYASTDLNRVLRIDPDAPEQERISMPLLRAEMRLVLAFAENSANGLIHAGGDDGRVLTYDAPGDTFTAAPPECLIRRIVAADDSVFAGSRLYPETADGLHLPWSLNRLRVEWSIPPRNGLGSEEYQYRLVGLHQEWSDWSSEVYRDFNHLPPGRYRFEVRARDFDDRIGPAAALPLTILPPWY